MGELAPLCKNNVKNNEVVREPIVSGHLTSLFQCRVRLWVSFRVRFRVRFRV